MEMKFDPITGQPIQEQNQSQEPQMKFDPMTGQPIQEQNQSQEPQMKFDPMTGQPVQEQNQPQEPQMKFDPMTGQPVQEQNQPQMKFDPMTGQPVQQGAQAPVYTMPAGKKKKSKLAVGIGIAVAVVAVCGVAFAGVKNGLFLSKSGKVAMATANTFSESSYLTKNLKGLGILATKSYTMDLNLDMGEEGILDANYVCTSSGKQLSGSVRVPYAGNVEFLAGIDSKEVRVQIPTIGDDVYLYNYTEEKTGYLADQLKKDDLDSIDELCKTIYSNKEQKKHGKEFTQIFVDQYKNLTFESVAKQSFEVDGKDRKCKGYQTTITEDDMMDMTDKLEDYTRTQLGDTLDDTMDIRDTFDEARDALDGMDDIDMTFYIYKNKLACVELESEGDDIQVVFHGGKQRTQNIEILVNDDTEFEIKGETNGKVEESDLYVEGSRVASFEYDYSNGKYSASIDEYGDLDGTLKSDRNGFEFSLDGQDISFEMKLSKGAKLQEISGDTIDIGNASESELQKLWAKYLGIDSDYDDYDDYDYDYNYDTEDYEL